MVRVRCPEMVNRNERVMNEFFRTSGSPCWRGRLFFTLTACLSAGRLILAEEQAADTKVLHAFSFRQNDGSDPQGNLLEGSDGALYGATTAGGSDHHGTVFKVNKDGSGHRVLHNFRSIGNGGRAPQSGVIEGQDGSLYGTTAGGGVAGAGTVFKIGKDGTDYLTLHSFAEIGGFRSDGLSPYGPLTQSKGGVLIGTTELGGAYRYGSLFRLNTNGTDYNILHHFGYGLAGDGKNPRGALLQASDGDFYGTTTAGPQLWGGSGTVFAISEDGSHYRLVHSFLNRPSDGATPYAGVIEGGDGKLYGTTVAGGGASQGVVFRCNKDGGAYEILRSFSGLGTEGRNLYGPVLEGRDGALYGTTLGGGLHLGGSVFRLNRDGTDFRVIFAFAQTGSEGKRPYAGLTKGNDDALYGTTCSGSAENLGAVFRIRVNSMP